MTRDPPRVAVIGAGISGVVTAAYLRSSNLEVTVFERSSRAGGVWIYDERVPNEVSYPAILASEGDSYREGEADEIAFAPPSPCYIGLKNNVATRLMRTKLSPWPEGTEDYVPHHVLGDYIQHVSRITNVEENTTYGARVTSLTKGGGAWQLRYSQLDKDGLLKTGLQQQFESVVVASGHYHAPRVPDIPGLKEWRDRWPTRVWHSKAYRNPEGFRNKSVVVIGGGTSSFDIVREINQTASTIYQSTRNGLFDFPAAILPEKAVRIGEITSFSFDRRDSGFGCELEDGPIPATITLKSGQKLCNIDYVIVATGYHMSLPFLKHLHDDNMPVREASDTILVTDGTQIHNLHKDMFYIPDPTLMFVGIPYFSATFTLFEFQAIAVAAVLAGRASLPSAKAMRKEYEGKVALKGYGKPFHSVRGQEEKYVVELMEWINNEAGSRGLPHTEGHTPEWHQAKQESLVRLQALFGDLGPRLARGGAKDTVPEPEPVLPLGC